MATSVKGSTVYVPLKDHAVRWNHTVEVVVDMKVSRESGELMPTELKLQLQEVCFPSNFAFRWNAD